MMMMEHDLKMEISLFLEWLNDDNEYVTRRILYAKLHLCS